jgi:hypothetical protein
VLQPALLLQLCSRMRFGAGMTGISTNDNQGRQHINRAQTSRPDDHWRRPAVRYPRQKILSWRWTVLIVTTLSTLCWIAIVLMMIAVLANV